MEGIYNPREVVSVPVDGDSEKAISSDWAFDHAADLDAHIRSFWEKLRTGEYYSSPAITNSNAVIAADTLYAMPFWVPRKTTWDRIAIHVHTAAAGNIRMGIYEDGTNLYPGDLIEDSGLVDTGTTGIKAITISRQLTKGLYWLAFVGDAAPTLKILTPTMSPLGLRSTRLDFLEYYWNVAFVFGALPDPFTDGGSKASSHIWAEALRLLSLD